MSPKRRVSNKHLPSRVYLKHGSYYYVDSKNKWHRLGKTLSESMVAWTKMVSCDEKIHSMDQLFDRYLIEVAPLKSPKTYKDNILQMSPLRIWFGKMNPEEVTAVDIYKYIDKRSVKAKVGANREKALLSHTFSMAIRWGIVKDNPCRNVKRISEKPRKRYISDQEFSAVHAMAPDLIKHVMTFAYLTGQRIGDILKIKLSDITDNGIEIEQGKTGAKISIQWSDALGICVNQIKKLTRPIRGMHLFCNRKGAKYTVDGFSSMWQRLMKQALKNEIIKESFTFHDIRAKTRSDSENGNDISKLLGHADTRITERVYNRKPNKVLPLK